jgi:hypothetical protein
LSFSYIVFEMGISLNLLDCPPTHDSPVSASCIAGITNVGHQAWLRATYPRVVINF